jgi:hypothetical protein
METAEETGSASSEEKEFVEELAREIEVATIRMMRDTGMSREEITDGWKDDIKKALADHRFVARLGAHPQKDAV